MRWQVKKRMEFIKETLEEKGHINRKDIMEEFGIAIAQASIDLQKFQEIYPDAAKYNLKLKRYEKGA